MMMMFFLTKMFKSNLIKYEQEKNGKINKQTKKINNRLILMYVEIFFDNEQPCNDVMKIIKFINIVTKGNLLKKYL